MPLFHDKKDLEVIVKVQALYEKKGFRMYDGLNKTAKGVLFQKLILKEN